MWYRIFGLNEKEVPPANLAAHLHALGLPVEPHFKGDDLGWTEGELRLPAGGTPIYLARYLTDEDDLRDDLNTHAAELETMDYSPNSGPLMERVIQTRQLITLRKPVGSIDEIMVERLLDAVCRYLAPAIDGVIQIDGRGWFTASGEMLVQEY